MEFEGHTGCLDFEKKDGQKFIVSLDIFMDRIKGCYTDDLADTADYSKIYEAVKEIVTSDTGDLIEHLAQKIADGVLKSDSRIEKVIVTVSKPEAPVKGIFETMEVTIERNKMIHLHIFVGYLFSAVCTTSEIFHVHFISGFLVYHYVLS